MIQKYGKQDIIDDPDVWKKVIVRTPVKIVKDLAIASRHFYKSYRKGNNWSPLHIVANSKDLPLCKQIFQKLKLRDPKSKTGRTPLHIAASRGNTEIYKYSV